MDPQICRKGPAEGGLMIIDDWHISRQIGQWCGQKMDGDNITHTFYAETMEDLIIKMDQYDWPISDDDPDRCPYGSTCFMPGCDCSNDCPRYPHGGDDW